MAVKTVNMKLQQKWLDFVNPTELEHYGYCFTESEMRQFPEGRIVLCKLRKEQRQRSQIAKLYPVLALAAKQINETLDKLVLDWINGN